MEPYSNVKIDIRRFKTQLSEWLPIVELRSITEQLKKYDGADAYGKTYIVKRDRQTRQYAVYIIPLKKQERTGRELSKELEVTHGYLDTIARRSKNRFMPEVQKKKNVHGWFKTLKSGC